MGGHGFLKFKMQVYIYRRGYFRAAFRPHVFLLSGCSVFQTNGIRDENFVFCNQLLESSTAINYLVKTPFTTYTCSEKWLHIFPNSPGFDFRLRTYCLHHSHVKFDEKRSLFHFVKPRKTLAVSQFTVFIFPAPITNLKTLSYKTIMLPDVLHECETWETCGHHGSEDGDVAPLRCDAGTYLKSSRRHNPEEQHRRCEHCLPKRTTQIRCERTNCWVEYWTQKTESKGMVEETT
jgi:hypothetical protein